MTELDKRLEELVRFDLTQGYRIGYFYDNLKPGFLKMTAIVAVLYALFKMLEHMTAGSWGDTIIGKILFYALLGSLALSVISGAINFLKSLSERAKINKLKNEREAIIREIDKLATGNIQPWWKKFDGIRFGIRTPLNAILIWAKANKVSYVDGKKVLNDSVICTGESIIKGRALIDSYMTDKKTCSKYYVFPSVECIEADKTYKIADMCFYDVKETLVHVTEGRSQEEIEAGMREYREKLDRREIFENTVRNDRELTNEQMRRRGEMSQEEFGEKSSERDWMELYKLRDLSQTKTRVTTDGTFTHLFTNGGYLIFDEDCNTVVAFILKKKLDEVELYYTTEPELGDDCEIVRGPVYDKAAGNEKSSIMSALALMKDYLLIKPKSLVMPKGCSVKQWGTWVYLHYQNIIKEEK